MPEDVSFKRELEALRLEKERLELERLREDVEQLKARKEKKQASHEQVEADLAEFRARQSANQRRCNHRKGGRDLEGLAGRGNSSEYAVIQHQFSTGEIGVLCLRCQKLWMPGDAEYQQALSFPTDNTMSQSAQFRVEKVAA